AGVSATKKRKGKKGKKGKHKGPTPPKVKGGFPGGFPGGVPQGGGMPELSQLGGGSDGLPPGVDPSKLDLQKNRQEEAGDRAMYHLRGVVLPDGVERDVWIDDGRITFEPVEGARTLDGAFLVPGLVDAHCHLGIGADGPTTLEQASEQALRDRDAGTLLIRDCGLPIDVRPLQQRDDLPRIIRSGQHLTLPKRYLPGLGLELDHPDQLPD